MDEDIATAAMGQASSQVRIQGVEKIFRSEGREITALTGIDLEFERGEFICILGPSGCGKSTLLNAIAGFSLPTSGTILVDGVPVTAPGPERAMVFQEYALFPWMTVADNVAFGLTIKKLPQSEVRDRVRSLLQQLQLTDFRDRFPKDLSGGMRQRVAIARALALDSPIMLMDEPFGALDALTRRTLQDELLRIWMEFRKTVVFVTHSIQESVFLADRVVVMTYRPGTVKKIVRIDLPHPRDTTALPFIQLQQELTGLVMEEQMRYQRDEIPGPGRAGE
jgi:NitT/TauT family transport system ATP-binding protein